MDHEHFLKTTLDAFYNAVTGTVYRIKATNKAIEMHTWFGRLLAERQNKCYPNVCIVHMGEKKEFWTRHK